MISSNKEYQNQLVKHAIRNNIYHAINSVIIHEHGVMLPLPVLYFLQSKIDLEGYRAWLKAWNDRYQLTINGNIPNIKTSNNF